MAEPNVLPLRSPLTSRRACGVHSRKRWSEAGAASRTCAQALRLSRSRTQTCLEIRPNDGETIEAEAVVLAIGVQGNP
jgi:hypothetical protein